MAQKQFAVWHIATFPEPCALNSDRDKAGDQGTPVTASAMLHLGVEMHMRNQSISRRKNSGYFSRTKLVQPVFKVM